MKTVTFETGNRHKIKAQGIKLEFDGESLTDEFMDFVRSCKDVEGFEISNREVKQGVYLYVRTSHSYKFEDGRILTSLPSRDFLAPLFEDDYVVKDKAGKCYIVPSSWVIEEAEESNDIDL